MFRSGGNDRRGRHSRHHHNAAPPPQGPWEPGGDDRRGRHSRHHHNAAPPPQGLADLEPLSREVSQLLRHRGLPTMRADGFAPLRSVQEALRMRASREALETLVRISCRAGGEPRFELLRDGSQEWIRASHKHSIPGLQGMFPESNGAAKYFSPSHCSRWV